MKEIKLSINPYASNVRLFEKDIVPFQTGLTVLVGANGTGKSTLLRLLEEYLNDNKIPVCSFNNLTDGGNRGVEHYLLKEDFALAAYALQSSEGENIMINLSSMAKRIGGFIKDGDPRGASGLSDTRKLSDENTKSKERWILLDATDSGLSIDNVVEMKHFFDLIISDSEKSKLKTYIIISANEYEMASGENCLDVRNRCYVRFKDYNDFRDFILKSRKDKDYRYKCEMAAKTLDEDNISRFEC